MSEAVVLDQMVHTVTRAEGEDCDFCDENVAFGTPYVGRTILFEGNTYGSISHPACFLKHAPSAGAA
jgi:hypothetical protein